GDGTIARSTCCALWSVREVVMKFLTACAAMISICAAPAVAIAQSGTAPYCLQTSAGARCVFSTMGECEKARGSTTTSQCITSTDARGTTGLGEPADHSSPTPVPPPP